MLKINYKAHLYKFAFILLLIINSLTAFSQFKPISFVRDSLPNGLQIIYCIDKSAPVVATVMQYKVGSRDEVQSQTGYAHFFEHLMFEATDDIPRATIDKYILEAGGSLNASTSFDQTVYHFRIPSNEIKLALWIESQRMRKLHVDTAGVETQRGVVLEEMKLRVLNQPYGTWTNKMFENLFKGSNYEWTPIGSAEDIKKAKIEDFKKFYDYYYQPNNATLAIVGDFDINQVKGYVRDYFGIYQKGTEINRHIFVDIPLAQSYKEKITDEKATLPAVYIGFRGPKLGEPDFYAVSLMTEILASGESSRLYQRLVDKEQISMRASLSPYSLQNSGVIILNSNAKPGKNIQKVEDIMLDEVKKLIDEGVTKEEFEKAKNITEADFVQGKKNVLEKANTLARYYSYFGDASLINTEIDSYIKVKFEDIQKVAKKYLDTDKKVILQYIPKNYKD